MSDQTVSDWVHEPCKRCGSHKVTNRHRLAELHAAGQSHFCSDGCRRKYEAGSYLPGMPLVRQIEPEEVVVFRPKAPPVVEQKFRKQCVKCGTEFLTRKTARLYCSHECRPRYVHKKTVVDLDCLECNISFSTRHYKVPFCSTDCRQKYLENRPYRRYPACSLRNRGATAELVVCADLVARGYDVYRAVGPNASFDLIASDGDQLVRIEATSGTISAAGRLTYDKHKGMPFDMIGVVVDSRQTYYFPSLDQMFK